MSTKLQQVIEAIKPINEKAGETALHHINNLTKPLGSLGELEIIGVKLAEITGKALPEVSPPGVIVFAADHGIADEGVSAYPQEVTAQMVLNLLSGGAGINVFTNAVNGMIEVVDVGVKSDIDCQDLIHAKIAWGTKNFAKEEAMTRDEAVQSLEIGMERAKAMIDDKGAKLLIVGELGIANTTVSSAITAILINKEVRSLVGQGTGILPTALDFKASVIEKALEKHKPNPDDAIDILQKVGGFEIGAMAGAMLYAASRRIPILLDGFICTASALLAEKLAPNVKDYMLAGHQSAEPGHKAALEALDKKPLLQLQLRLGEGSGAALAFHLVEASTKMMKEMATFEAANVSKEIEI